MNNFFNKLKMTYLNGKNMCILGMAGAIYLLPKLVKSITMLATKDALSVGYVSTVDLICGIIAMGLLVVGLSNCEAKATVKKAVYAIFNSGLFILAAGALITLVETIFGKTNIVIDNLGSSLIVVIPEITQIALGVILYGFFGVLFIINICDTKNSLSIGKLFAKAAAKFGWALLLGVMYGVTEILQYGVNECVQFISGGHAMSYATYITESLIETLIFYIVMLPVILKIKSSINIDDVDNVKSPVGPFIAGGVAVALFIVISIVDGVLTANWSNKAAVIDAKMGSYNALIAVAGENDRYIEASTLIDDYYSEIYAWRGILNKDSSYIDKARNIGNSEETNYLLNWYEYNNNKSYDGFRKVVLSPERTLSDTFAFIACVKDGNANEYDKSIRDELIVSLITSDNYIDSSIRPYSLTTKEKEQVNDSLAGYEFLADSFFEYKVAEAILLNGGMNEAIAKMCFDMADNHPDTIILQKIAFNACKQLGMNDYDYSNRNYGMKYAKRYDELFEGLYGVENGEETLEATDYVLEKLEIAAYYLEMDMNKEVIELLNAALKVEESEYFYDYISMAYGELGDSKNALMYLEKAYITDISKIENVDLLYRYAENYIRDGQYHKGIEAAGKMSELILAKEQPGEDNTYLAAIVSMLGCGDKRVAGNERSIYKYDFSDDDREFMKKYTYLNTLTELEYLYRVRSNDNCVKDSIDTLVSLCKKYPNISYSWYLLGNWYWEADNIEKAIESYKQSLEVDSNQAYCWFSLATAYDQIKDYASCRKACEEVLRIQPDNSHLNDPYGVTWHANLLLEKLTNAGY